MLLKAGVLGGGGHPPNSYQRFGAVTTQASPQHSHPDSILLTGSEKELDTPMEVPDQEATTEPRPQQGY